MSPKSSLPSVETLRRIEAICTRFEQTDADNRDIERFCEDLDGDDREYLIRELVTLDIELRAQHGEHRTPADYDFASEIEFAGLNLVPTGFLNDNLNQLADSPSSTRPSSQRYQIGQSIGSGGIGEVWRVYDLATQRSLALKTLHRNLQNDSSAIDRFEREGLLTGTLQHPGIPPIYDRGRLEDGTPFFTMKLVEGETLHQILRSRSADQEDLGHLLGVFGVIAQTMAYAHSQQVIHRDLKPHNIMVGKFGELQVMDWGLAKRLGCDPDSITLTQRSAAKLIETGSRIESNPQSTLPNDELTTAGDIVGTPGFMAPEQARGEIESLDERADVFGLGAILYQILLRRTLFQYGSRHEVIERTRQGDLAESLAALDELKDEAELVSLCKRCLDPDPKHRPVNAGEVAKVIESYTAGLEQRVRQAEIQRSETQVRIEETKIRQRWIIGLSTALSTVALVASVVVGIQWGRATTAAKLASDAKVVAEEEAIATSEINEYLDEILSASLPERHGYDASMKDVLDASLPRLEGRFQGRPRVEGSIRRTLGESYRWLGDIETAEEQLRLSLDAFEKSDSIDEIEIVETKDRLAGVLRTRGDDEAVLEAESLRTDVLDYCRTHLGRSHPRTVKALNNLGVVMLELDQPDKARVLFDEALKIIDSSPDLALVSRTPLIQNIAEIDRTRGDWASAEKLFKEVIDDPESSAHHLGNALVLLGEMYHWSDRYDESIKYLQDGLRVREELYGPLDRLTLSSMRKLSRVMDSADRHEDQLEFLKESIRRHTEAEWLGARSVFEARAYMANALIGLGRENDAIEYLQATVALAQEHRGVDDKYSARAQKQLAEFQKQLDEP